MNKQDIFEKELTTETAQAGDQKLGDKFGTDDAEVQDFENQDLGGDDGVDVIATPERDIEEDKEFDFDDLDALDDNRIDVDEDDYSENNIEEPEKPEGDIEEPATDVAELAQLNKTLNTDFKSLDELKKSMGKSEGATEQAEETVSKEILDKYEKNKDYIAFLTTQKSRNDKEIVFDHFKSKYKKENNDTWDEDAEMQIDDKISIMESNGSLDIMADSIKSKMDSAISTLNLENGNIDRQKKDITDRRNAGVRESIKDSIVEFVNADSFYGAKVSAEDAREVYNDITTGKFFKDVENSPKEVAELALFRKFKDVILKKAGGPSYSDGVKDIVSEIEGKKQDVTTAQVRNSTRGNAKFTDLKSRFMQ